MLFRSPLICDLLLLHISCHQGGYGTCVEAAWHGARVAVKRLLTPPRFGGGGGGGGIGGGHWGKTMPATTPVSAAAASAMRRQIRLLQSLRFDFLVPIYGVS